MRTQRAKFEFLDIPEKLPTNAVLIRDTDQANAVSVTNDAESVVETILRVLHSMNEPIAANTPPIYYYDSDGVLSQLEHDGLEFTRLAPCP